MVEYVPEIAVNKQRKLADIRGMLMAQRCDEDGMSDENGRYMRK